VQFNIRHLFCALEIRKHANLSEAARHVHLTQSALTQSIRKLEKSIGVPLFKRATTGMFVTPEGEVFLRRFERGFAYIEHFANTLFNADRTARLIFLRGIGARQLAALIQVVEHQSYTAASRVMGLTQPTLHRTIKELETLCGQSLFTRSPTGVEATWRARQLSRLAGLYFAELQQGLDELQELAGSGHGSLKLGSLPLTRTSIIPNAVLKLTELAPQAHISIVDGPYEEQLHALLHGQIDILIGALRFPPLSDEITQHHLFDDNLSLVFRHGHPLATEPTLSAADWSSLKWIVPKTGTPARAIFEELFATMKLPVPGDIIECSSLVATRGMLINSDRAALLPARQVEVDVRAGLLAVSPLKLGDPARQIGYTLRKGWTPTRLQASFLTILEQTKP